MYVTVYITRYKFWSGVGIHLRVPKYKNKQGKCTGCGRSRKNWYFCCATGGFAVNKKGMLYSVQKIVQEYNIEQKFFKKMVLFDLDVIEK